MSPSIIKEDLSSDKQAMFIERQRINETVDHGIKAIFFDLHGVLVDITGWHRVAFLSALQDFGFEVPISRSHPVWEIPGGTMKQLEYLQEIGYIKTVITIVNMI